MAYNRKANIKFTYNSVEYFAKIDIHKYLKIDSLEFFTTKITLDGSAYKQFRNTNEKKIFIISFPFVFIDLYTFFKEAHDAEIAGYDIQFSIENNSGSYDDYNVIFLNFNSEPVTVTSNDSQKIYKNTLVELQEK